MTVYVQDLSECSLLHCVTPAPLEFGDDEPLQETKSVKPNFYCLMVVVIILMMMMMMMIRESFSVVDSEEER